MMAAKAWMTIPQRKMTRSRRSSQPLISKIQMSPTTTVRMEKTQNKKRPNGSLKSLEIARMVKLELMTAKAQMTRST